MTTNWAPGAPDRPTSDPLTVLKGKTDALRALHRPGQPLLLPNAWDVPSARAVVAAGLPAVATSSAAVAETLGYTDGENAPVAEVLDAVARIAAAVSVPVTAAMERGYGLAPVELVERLAAAGIAGCNLEDSDPATNALVDAGRQAEFLDAVRAAAQGFGLVINARVDTFLDPGLTPADRIDEAVRRGRRYLEAGADCVYPILCDDPDAIRILVRELGTVNILASPGAPSVSTLAGLGAARISWGPYLHRAVLAYTAQLIEGYQNQEI
jgi:2-methylisocitrate lyase-like PEP mutase family enzyme